MNTYVSQIIDDGIAYLTIFYGFLFDGITKFLRGMLSAISSVTVGTPWPITMGVLLWMAYKMAGLRVTIFVAASLVYLALFGFWQTAMDTLSLVLAASIICVVVGLPLGDGKRYADVVMENLIGFEADTWTDVLKDPDARLHLYGKSETREGRKMGHVNRIAPKAG